jgi:Glyoxalase/Bleomycin resistance protein/Dioxygenase superfamily
MSEPLPADQVSPFGALHHIGIAVREFEPARGNICALLRGTVIDQGEDNDVLLAAWLFMEAPGSVPIELVMPTGDGPIARYLARHGEGIHHISFQTGSVDASHEHATACGFRIIGENRDHGGAEELFIHPRLTGGALLHSFRLRGT